MMQINYTYKDQITTISTHSEDEWWYTTITSSLDGINEFND